MLWQAAKAAVKPLTFDGTVIAISDDRLYSVMAPGRKEPFFARCALPNGPNIRDRVRGIFVHRNDNIAQILWVGPPQLFDSTVTVWQEYAANGARTRCNLASACPTTFDSASSGSGPSATVVVRPDSMWDVTFPASGMTLGHIVTPYDPEFVCGGDYLLLPNGAVTIEYNPGTVAWKRTQVHGLMSASTDATFYSFEGRRGDSDGLVAWSPGLVGCSQALDEGLLFVLDVSDPQHIIAVSTKDGSIKWTTEVAPAGSLVHTDGTAMVYTDGLLLIRYQLNTGDLHIPWPAGGVPSGYGADCLYGTRCEMRVRAIRPQDGKVKWDTKLRGVCQGGGATSLPWGTVGIMGGLKAGWCAFGSYTFLIYETSFAEAVVAYTNAGGDHIPDVKETRTTWLTWIASNGQQGPLVQLGALTDWGRNWMLGAGLNIAGGQNYCEVQNVIGLAVGPTPTLLVGRHGALGADTVGGYLTYVDGSPDPADNGAVFVDYTFDAAQFSLQGYTPRVSTAAFDKSWSYVSADAPAGKIYKIDGLVMGAVAGSSNNGIVMRGTYDVATNTRTEGFASMFSSTYGHLSDEEGSPLVGWLQMLPMCRAQDIFLTTQDLVLYKGRIYWYGTDGNIHRI